MAPHSDQKSKPRARAEMHVLRGWPGGPPRRRRSGRADLGSAHYLPAGAALVRTAEAHGPHLPLRGWPVGAELGLL